MRLTAWEEERLLIFSAAELARRHREAGLRLNAPEAIALICDAMLEAARAGADHDEVEAAGYEAVGTDAVLPGVTALVPEVRLEVLMDDGTRRSDRQAMTRPGRSAKPSPPSATTDATGSRSR
jgi:urease subunit gamma/beta